MAKTKTIFVCRECGAESSKWMGRCNQCGEWNTYVEETIVTKKSTSSSTSSVGNTVRPMQLSEIEITDVNRTSTCNGELDRVLGGGIVPGALILIGGEPGIGKSTLVLQTALSLPYS